MPPIAEQILSPQLDALKTQLAEIANSTTSDEAYQRMIAMHKSTLQILESVSISIQNSEKSIADSESRAMASHRKPLSESRCVSSLKMLGSDKSEFKNWNEKLINALSQSFGRHWRVFMENLNRKLDQDRKVMDAEELNRVEGAAMLNQHDTCSEDLYYVLVEKTEGDAALRVNSGEPGDGIKAYMRVYLWFAGTTGLALTEKPACSCTQHQSNMNMKLLMH